MKEISVRQFASIKRIAMNVNPLVVKKNKLVSKITELTAEITQLNDEIEGNEMGIKAITGGIGSEALVVKKVVDSGKVDKNNNPIKITKYEPNPERLQWNEEKKVYILTTLEDNLEEQVKEDWELEQEIIEKAVVDAMENTELC